MSYYTKLLEKYGTGVKALGWGSVESQLLRFKVLTEIADLKGSTVLDFGCGFGDLYDYLHGSTIYIGCDDNLDMLRAAKDKYPYATFVTSPIEADYVLVSGTFNLREDWWDDIVYLWGLCRNGMALSFTSNLAERQTPGIVYADPFDTARSCSHLTKKFVLRHDYKPNDFAVYLYR